MKSNTTTERLQKFYDQSYDRAIEYVLVKTGDVNYSKATIADCYKTILKALRNGNECDDNTLSETLYQHLDKKIREYWKKHQSFAPLSREILVNREQEEQQIQKELFLPLSESVSALPLEVLSQIVLNCLNAQPPLQRRAFILHTFFQNTVEESAQKLDISPATAALYIKETLQNISSALTTQASEE